MFLKNKADYTAKLFEILNPLLPHYSKGGARLKIDYTGASYDTTVIEAEGFIRALWGIAPYLGGGGSNKNFEEIYLKGIANGTNPQSSEYWGDCSHFDQRLVEMAGIAVALLFAPDKFWAPLTEEEKNNLAKWLDFINSKRLVPSNWQFFGVLVNVALKKLGRPEFNQKVMGSCLDSINSYYQGDGWYKDGVLESHDYYIPFAFHYYGIIYYAFMKDEDPVNANKFKERALLFGKQYVYWFADTGESVPYGRSLTYRFAEVSFFSACVYAGLEPLPLSVMKGIIDRHLQYWWSTNMLDFAGLLSIGYNYPNLVMAENYNAPGSPLWALKAFILLALDDKHPYWTEEASAFPKLEPIKYLPVAQMLITQKPNHVVLYPNGIHPGSLAYGHFEEKYTKFAYSTKYGFSIRKADDCLENMAPDSDLVFEYQGHFYGRDTITNCTITETQITSTWSPVPEITVTTTITPNSFGHTREHKIVSSVPCTVYDCGFAMSLDEKDYSQEVNENSATVRSALGSCTIQMSKSEGTGSITGGKIIKASPNTNLLFPRSTIPAVCHTIDVGTTTITTNVIVDK